MRRPPVSAVSLLAVATVAFVVAVAVVVVITVRSGGDTTADGTDGRADAAGSASSAPDVVTLADLAAADLDVRRDAFCADVDDAEVEAALSDSGQESGSKSDSKSGSDVTADSYDNGDLLPADAVAAGGSGADAVAHEYGCSWTAADGAVARAWVFAPPVAKARAKRLAAAADRAEGCAATTSEPFGDPSAAYACTSADAVTAGHAGLFGDAWLACTVSNRTATAGVAEETQVTALQARADRWCVAAARAAHG